MKEIIKIHSTLTSYNYYSFINNIFQFLNNNDSGGAIWANNINLQLFILNCFFLSCSSTKYGGAVASYNGNYTEIIQSCFFNCSAYPQAPSIFFWGDTYTNLKVLIQFISESTSILSSTGSTVNSNSFNSNNMNISNICTDQHAGFYFASISTNSLHQYCQICNVIGISFIGFYLNKNIQIYKFNFINNTIFNSWSDIHGSLQYPVFNNCYFSNNSLTNLYRHIYGGSGYLIFNNCYFNYLYNNYFFSINFKINLFQLNLNSLDFTLYEENLCYNFFSKPNLQKKKISTHSIFILFLFN